MSGKIKLLLLVLGIVLLGFGRDYLFMNINWIYLTLTTGRRNQALDEFHFLLQWTPAAINQLKWVLTFLFSGLYLALTWLIIRQCFHNRLYNQISLLSYLALTGLAFGLYLISFLTGLSPNLYGVIRTLMGLVQSFMPLMILYLLFKFLPKQSDQES